MVDQSFLWTASHITAFAICVLLQAPLYFPIHCVRKRYNDDSALRTWSCGWVLRMAHLYVIRHLIIALLEAFLLVRLPPIVLFSLIISAKVSIVIMQDVLEYTYPPRISVQLPRMRFLVSSLLLSLTWFLPFLKYEVPEPKPFDSLMADQMSILFCCLCVAGAYLLRRSAFSARHTDSFEAYVRESVVYLICPALLFSVSCVCAYALSNGLWCTYNVWIQKDAISRNKSYSFEWICALVIMVSQILLKHAASNLKSCVIISQKKYTKRLSSELGEEFTEPVCIPVCNLSPNTEVVDGDVNEIANSSESLHTQTHTPIHPNTHTHTNIHSYTQPVRERYTQHSDYLPSVVPQKTQQLPFTDKQTNSAQPKCIDSSKHENKDVSIIKSLIYDLWNLQLLPNPIRYVALTLMESMFLIFTCSGIIDGTSNIAEHSRSYYWVITIFSLSGLGGLLSRSMLLPFVQSSGLGLAKSAPPTHTQAHTDTMGSEVRTHTQVPNTQSDDTNTGLKIISTDDTYMTNIELENEETEFPLNPRENSNESFPLTESGSVNPSPLGEKVWRNALRSVRTNDPRGTGLTRILSDLSDEDDSDVRTHTHKDDTNSQNLKLFDSNAAGDVIREEHTQTHTHSLMHYFRRFQGKADKKAWTDPFADLDNCPNNV